MTQSFDVVVVGAGLTGLAATLGLAQAGLSVACVGPPERAAPGRTVALLGASLDLFERLGALARIKASGAPMRALRLVDDTGGLFAPPPVTFRAGEIGLDAFGFNIENARLSAILADGLSDSPPIGASVTGFAFDAAGARLSLSDGRTLAARLVVGADGRNSPSRKAARIDASARRTGQQALTLILRHARPHDDASTEFHTREGPFTLVPLPPTPQAPHRSSLVWLMREDSATRRRALSDAALAAEIRTQAKAMLGDMEIEGERGWSAIAEQRVARLVAPRLALVGDAAHAFPPIGAQGLNLGLRDVAELIRLAERGEVGGAAMLAAYERARRGDVGLRAFAVGALNASLLSRGSAVAAARG